MQLNAEDALIEKLRGEFKIYLEIEHAHLKDKNVVLSDALYVSRHNVGMSFWEALRSDYTLEKCREKLESYFINVRKHENPRSNSFAYIRSIKLLKEYIEKRYGGVQALLENEFNNDTIGEKDFNRVKNKHGKQINNNKYYKVVPTPCKSEVEKYLSIWDNLENYVFQESALEKLFLRTYPNNTEIDDVLIKVSSLNDFYSTNIYSPYTVAKHIVNLDIDERLEYEDINLVNDIAKVKMDNGSIKNFYSFATKYCSHHKPLVFPIYDSYVEKVLRYFRDRDNFSYFGNSELKNYSIFIEILFQFKTFYNLEKYSLKDIDKYLWLLGKEKFLNK